MALKSEKIFVVELTQSVFSLWNQLKSIENITSDVEFAECLFSYREKYLNGDGGGSGKKRGRPKKPVTLVIKIPNQNAPDAAVNNADRVAQDVKLKSKNIVKEAAECNKSKEETTFKESTEDASCSATPNRSSNKYALRKNPKRKEPGDGIMVYHQDASDSDLGLQEHCSFCDGNHESYRCNRHCFKCNKTYANKYVYQIHENTKHPVGSTDVIDKPDRLRQDMTCDQCSAVFNQKRFLLLHKAKFHNEGEVYNCSKCTVACVSAEAHCSHVERVHGGSNPHRCDYCQQTFATKYGLRNHKLRVHPDHMWMCDSCGKIFSCVMYLRNHKRRKHSAGDADTGKRFPCALCHKSFGGRGSLAAHFQAMHHKVRFQCGTCGEMYTSRAQLTAHIRFVHETERKGVECDVCQRVFRTAAQLKRHALAGHNDKVKQFQCSVCSKLFVYKRQAIRHLEQVHHDLVIAEAAAAAAAQQQVGGSGNVDTITV